MALYVLVSFVVGLAFGYLHRRFRPEDFQNRGEARVSRELRTHFASSDYHLLNHVTLRLGDGTTQIDHILVSRFGVYVIETKHYNGWIFADARQRYWTQVLFNARFKFQNPLHQNYRHLCAVRELLDFLSPESIRPVVVFTGPAQFKTDTPPGVFRLSDLIDHLRYQKQEIMSANRMHFCIGRLEATRLTISGETDLEHLKSLEQRHSR